MGECILDIGDLTQPWWFIKLSNPTQLARFLTSLTHRFVSKAQAQAQTARPTFST